MIGPWGGPRLGRPPRDLDVVIPLDEPTAAVAVGSKAVAPCPAGGLHDERLFTRPLHLWFFLASGAAVRACAVDEVSGAPLRGLQPKEAPRARAGSREARRASRPAPRTVAKSPELIYPRVREGHRPSRNVWAARMLPKKRRCRLAVESRQPNSRCVQAPKPLRRLRGPAA